MKTKLFLVSALAIGICVSAQTQACYTTPDGTDVNNWSYKDYVIPTGYKIDSVYMNATRPGYPSSQDAFSMTYCPSSSSYSNCTGGTVVLNYSNFTTSMYNIWLRVDTANVNAPGMVRVVLPTNAGAVWNQLCFAISATNCANITSGLVAQYNFSGNANDASGNANNGTVFGATLTTDRFGNPNSAYSFNGSDSIVVVNSSSLQFASNIISVSFWVKYASFASAGNDNILISKQSGSGSTQQGFNIEQGQNADGTTNFLVSNQSGFGGSPTNTISIGSTNHIVMIYNNGTSTTYVNGVSVNTGTSTATIGTNTMPLIIGAANWNNSNAQPFSGVLDDIRIYNTALTACDVDSLYNMANPNTTGITSQDINTRFLVYPNPASDEVNILYGTNENKPVTIELTNLMGQTFKAETKASVNGDNSYQINISDLAPGLYFISIGSTTQKVQVIK